MKIVAIKSDFCWGSAPGPAGEAHGAPSDLLTGFYGVLLLKEEREEKRGRHGT